MLVIWIQVITSTYANNAETDWEVSGAGLLTLLATEVPLVDTGPDWQRDGIDTELGTNKEPLCAGRMAGSVASVTKKLELVGHNYTSCKLDNAVAKDFVNFLHLWAFYQH